jgi:hypothetical protein
MYQYHVVQVLVQSLGGGPGGQAKYAHPGQHTDIGVKSHEHTDYYHFRARITICFSDDPYHTISRGLL